ncbi:acylphosphatase [Microbacterium sp. 22242]|uniref:acylphosphatase n=1 Tax=Microbacterium sp. 22242 TaxID=3453896 RepID=UPI003F861F97
MRRVHVEVAGEVQGVGYRYTMLMVARQAEVSGWVRNRHDGRVEAEVEGADARVDEVLAWMARGPRGARVRAIDTTELAPVGDTGFDVRRDV